MENDNQERFQILALSGGGFRGLYTAKILADLEQEIGCPIAEKFDLIAGTSIGGILALAVAMEIPAANIVKLFEEHGEEIFKRRYSFLGMYRAPYSADPLAALIADKELFGGKLLGECKHPVIVPAINYSTGMPQIFKTPHNPNLKRDHQFRIVDRSGPACLNNKPRDLSGVRVGCKRCRVVHGGGRRLRRTDRRGGQLGAHQAWHFRQPVRVAAMRQSTAHLA